MIIYVLNNRNREYKKKINFYYLRMLANDINEAEIIGLVCNNPEHYGE